MFSEYPNRRFILYYKFIIEGERKWDDNGK